MSAENRTVRITEIPGEPWRFRVESWSDPANPHVVDLLQHRGAGECSCWNWKRQRWPLIRDAEAQGLKWETNPHVFCRHVKVARNYRLNSLLRKLSVAAEIEREEANP